jgi:hypothetical protein
MRLNLGLHFESKSLLVLRAYLELIRVDLQLMMRGFPAVHSRVRNFRCRSTSRGVDEDKICRSVDIACVFYFKEVLCLQRSAATTCLLRGSGAPAQMVIGVQQWPFRAHAWVEVEGRIVNDKPYVREIYGVLESC